MRVRFVYYCEEKSTVLTDGIPDEIVFLNKHIMRTCSENYEDINCTVLEEPLQDNDQYIESANRIETTNHIVLTLLSEFLDGLHNTDFGVDGWGLFLYAFLNVYLGSLLYSYLKVKDLQKKRVDVQYDGLPMHYVPYNIDELYDNSWFCDQLTEYVLNWHYSKKMPGALLTQYKEDVPKENADHAKQKGIKKILKKTINSLAVCNPRVVLAGGYIYGGVDLLAGIITFGRVRRQSINNVEKRKIIVKTEERKRLKRKKDYGDDFINLAIDLLPYVIPVEFVEEFTYIVNSYHNMNLKIPEVFLTTRVVFYSIPMGLYLLETRKSHGKIYLLQHGGGYAIDMKPWGICEYKLADKYYTWGNGINKIVDGAGGKAEAFQVLKTIGRRKSRYKRGGILFAGYNTSEYVHDINAFSIWRNERLMSLEDAFIANLTEEVRGRIKYRPYGAEKTFKRRPDLIYKFPDIRFDQEIDFYESLCKADLFVTCYLSTTYLEAINLDIPTIVISSNQIHIYDDSFLPIVEKLKDVKVLFEDSKEAAIYLSQICNHINDWWNEGERKRIIDQFRKMYCNRLRFPFLKSLVWMLKMS